MKEIEDIEGNFISYGQARMQSYFCRDQMPWVGLGVGLRINSRWGWGSFLYLAEDELLDRSWHAFIKIKP